jgi:hypothetical protein
MSVQALLKSVLLEYGETGATRQAVDHTPHCIEYLRQTLMCAADLTLERVEDSAVYPPSVDGWGNAHQCKVWDDVVDAVTRRALIHGHAGWVRLPHPWDRLTHLKPEINAKNMKTE